MEPSTWAQGMGKFHQVRGRLEEQLGKLAKDRESEAKGRLEGGASRVQEKTRHVDPRALE
jgi:uncharacterized protein YjbJ (UPF0337 family)